MARKNSAIAEINHEKQSWNLVARVVRVWLVSDFSKQKLPLSLEMVLMDNKGDRMHAYAKKTLVYRFQKEIKEGSVYSFQYMGVAENTGEYRTSRHSYKLCFQYDSKVSLVSNDLVPTNVYTHVVPISEIVGGFDTDYLVDVMGLLTGVGSERFLDKSGKKTKMNVIQLEADGFKLECTLFGNYVDELNSFLAAGDAQNAVVLVQFAKVKTFKEKYNVQNCMSCTRIIFNPDFDEAVQLRMRMNEIMQSPSQPLSHLSYSSELSGSEDFLDPNTRKTLAQLKDCKEDSAYVVYASIKHIIDDEDWCYTACVIDNKAVYPDEKLWFCEKCNRHVRKVAPRYRIKLRVMDDTDSATFVIFDRDASILFNMSCSDMYDKQEKSGVAGGLPKQISDLKDKSFIFKVETKNVVNSRFDQSFRVKKVFTDLSIIKKFKEILTESIERNVNSVNKYWSDTSGALIGDSSSPLAQDLLVKFSTSAMENESQTDEMVEFDKTNGLQELTPQISQAKEASKVGNELKELRDVTMISTEDESQFSESQIQLAQQSSPMEVLNEFKTLKRSSGEKEVMEPELPLKYLRKNIKIEKD